MNKNTLIAIVGMDGIFPGAPDLDTFWTHIVKRIDQSVPAPEHRWIASPKDRLSSNLVPDRTYSRNACLIRDFTFDPNGFKLDSEVTRHLDPVHQLTLTAGKRAVAACSIADVDPQRVDTILAAIALPTDSASAFTRTILGKAIARKLFPEKALSQIEITRAQALGSRVDGLPAALLAAEMGFGGNCFTLDAACASSSYAVKLACDALAFGRADMVVTGGVSRPECLYTQTGFSQLQALSRSGRCAPFDHRADGLVVGEGVGILVLKRLSDAIDQGDTIHGVIHGIGLSNDMRGNLLAPESRGQVRAMQAAYAIAGWRPSDVDLIECHGTGTRAGDTTEIESLVQLWQDESRESGVCAIGSVKSMIGHLLTAAGAAGLIKVLLAMRHRTLPPSINFDRPPADSPLPESPFRVQTEADPWKTGGSGKPMRAAVSAFGFGGINAHILLQEWPSPSVQTPDVESHAISVEINAEITPVHPVAIVGMDVAVGSLNQLKSFEKAIFQGTSVISRRPEDRWKGADAEVIDRIDGIDPSGAYMQQLDLTVGEFQIPPKEIGDILPQQLLALKVGAGALQDAGLPLKNPGERMGVVMGIGFDFEATNFHLRWQLQGAADRWNADHGLDLDEDSLKQWIEQLRKGCGPPLTPSRVMGALGGIVASRMAREFRFGGPSFVVSADTASGIQSLQVAVDLLRQDAVDAMLVGAVDLAGEARNLIRLHRWLPLSKTDRVRPFDAAADGTLPGDGAAALVLKRLDRAKADNDRIYAVIHGIGTASGGDPVTGELPVAVYARSLSAAFRENRIRPGAVSYLEVNGSGVPERDRGELEALTQFFDGAKPADPSKAIALGSSAPIGGFTGAAHGLVSLTKAALCLHRLQLPPLPGCDVLTGDAVSWGPFHIPRDRQPWYRDREDGPRIACCASVTMDGSCGHVLLQEYETPAETPVGLTQPLSSETTPGLFALTGDTQRELAEGLAKLETYVKDSPGPITVESAAARWMASQPPQSGHKLAIVLIVQPDQHPEAIFQEARRALDSDGSDPFSKQVFYTGRPMGADAKVVWVYPGSGNHYLGMGRELALRFPATVADMDRKTGRLKTQFRPWHLMPWRQSWQPQWEGDADHRLRSDPLNMIFGQVVFGSLMTDILKRFSIPADNLIGYSLGESAALFAHGVWSDRGDMLKRMQATDLFTTQLSGPCQSLRLAWNIPETQPADWKVAVVNRPYDRVREILKGIEHVRLLIVNTPEECVIGGLAPAVEQAVAALSCQAVYLDGVVTVHCDAARPVAEAYRQLHHFPTTAVPGLAVYSCSWGKAYDVTPDSVSDSIEKQAVDGFDFTRTINQAYADGGRVFIEAGPRSSCSRMIDRILADKPHLAVAANQGNANEVDALLRCLARLFTERVPMDLSALYNGFDVSAAAAPAEKLRVVSVPVGGQRLEPALPKLRQQISSPQPSPETINPQQAKTQPATPTTASIEQLLETAQRNMQATADAHQRFLDISQEMTQAYADTFELQNRLLAAGAQPTEDDLAASVPPSTPSPAAPVAKPAPAFDRDMCMEFAIGKVGRVLGPTFDVVDSYRVRVRLPDEPLMLVDRILSVEGEMLSMVSGKVVTEHDVLPGAWYLDGDRAPVCISVEAGQADLFLSSYLGIDHQVKGERAYRLLDAVVTFHRGLPRPGDTIRYEIAIDRFVRQGDTWMFFFRFEGFIGDQHLISMRDGCAGFFTEAEVRNSGGIILTESERKPVAGKCPANWRPLVPMEKESYSDDQVDALRRGDLAGCFSSAFEGIVLADSLHLPGGGMHLIHRVLELDPTGGRYGLGMIRAEADIHPDDWFLTCHFVDDKVMPGTLMYECCAHTLRVFLQRMGWVTDKPGACYEPVIGNGARLKCRGPVTPSTRHVHYEIQISEIGYGPEPYVVADAHMSADGRPIVFFKDMSMQMSGVGREDIEAVWRRKPVLQASPQKTAPLYDRASILAFATGNPSEAFGEPYRVFDQQRKIARLPGPPYCFMDRVIAAEPKPWKLAPGGWITAQYDLSPNEWYFAADRSGVMPFCVLLEIALQPCGWLAAYVGSALRSQRDLKFRNLGGSAVLHRQVTPDTWPLTMRCRMTKVSEAADMIIENFDFEVLDNSGPVYTGDTYFGFFSAEALAQQKGLGAADPMVQALASFSNATEGAMSLTMEPPITPDEAASMALSVNHLELPGKALLMVDEIAAHFDVDADEATYIRGIKQVDPEEWFFKAHFYQDPVCPGSLGLESFIQLMKTAAMKRWPELTGTHRFRVLEGSRHTWTYRGQIIPTNKTVAVEARIACVADSPIPLIRADGLLSVDGLPIYKMENFELALVPATESRHA
ncbi:beta-ketoacyl synthase N-terminal-like domain-containing protein [uncultured Desulfosarcina sp.]|uniref:beta-ketoacyl synthase N-terminal-like domain-containing protein n=1 Tax=uncultured Desulfosarcina sp. TaxID=218289 RepID=UPI0029C7CCC7|nr:beta-ketoacyl synthase N-terminal-like domain-containing protein [uncultured Desulfosarcina sp.]